MKTYIKITLGVVMLIAIAGIGAGLYYYNLKPKDLSDARPDFVMSATLLQKAFEDNESAATAKYVSKVIEVSGEIASVKPGENNSINIAFKTGSDVSAVICTFPAANKPGDLAAGSSVTIRGVCSGYLMDVLLNNCVIAKK
jgi:hypothetical protein